MTVKLQRRPAWRRALKIPGVFVAEYRILRRYASPLKSLWYAGALTRSGWRIGRKLDRLDKQEARR